MMNDNTHFKLREIFTELLRPFLNDVTENNILIEEITSESSPQTQLGIMGSDIDTGLITSLTKAIGQLTEGNCSSHTPSEDSVSVIFSGSAEGLLQAINSGNLERNLIENLSPENLKGALWPDRSCEPQDVALTGSSVFDN